MKDEGKDRCDHCRKWVKYGQLYTLEGFVSPGMDMNFAICAKCAEKHTDSEYWDHWTKTKNQVSDTPLSLSRGSKPL